MEFKDYELYVFIQSYMFEIKTKVHYKKQWKAHLYNVAYKTT